ncbi:hypothetical protein HPB47_028211, partial [Ixodes persulcatus]
ITEQHPQNYMVSTRSVLRLLHTLIKATGAKRFLDIGVFTGCSSLAAALALPDDGRVVGLDVCMEFAKIGMPFWKEAAVDHKIDVRFAPASESLDSMIKNGETFDMIFIDADKQGYLDYFKKSMKVLKKNGIVAIDNQQRLDFTRDARDPQVRFCSLSYLAEVEQFRVAVKEPCCASARSSDVTRRTAGAPEPPPPAGSAATARASPVCAFQRSDVIAAADALAPPHAHLCASVA